MQLKLGGKKVKGVSVADDKKKEIIVPEASKRIIPTELDREYWMNFYSLYFGENGKPLLNFNSSPHNQNLTRMVMKSADPNLEDYFQVQKFLACILYISPEPRLYQNSIHLQNQKIIFRQAQNINKN